MEHGRQVPETALLATVRRSGCPESWHHGALVVVEGDRVLRALGDPETPIWTRSAIKPLQALPVLERGIAERERFTDAELAILSASHGGTPRHVEVARGLLERGGFSETDLRCGPHAPLDAAAAADIARAGRRPGRIHNNCSGKHAGFLFLARDLGVPAERYLDPESESQRLVRGTVAEIAGIGEPDVGLDGCGAPTLRMPLVALARAFSRLANPGGLAPVRAAACRRLLHAVAREPLILAGEGRLCTGLVRSAPGRVYPKNGAEGIYAVGIAGAGIGLAVKVADGAQRGYLPAVVETLRGLGLWQERVPEPLRGFHRVPVYNTQRVVVGHVASAFSWES